MTAVLGVTILVVVALVMYDIARISSACLAVARCGERPALGRLGGQPTREREH